MIFEKRKLNRKEQQLLLSYKRLSNSKNDWLELVEKVITRESNKEKKLWTYAINEAKTNLKCEAKRSRTTNITITKL